MYPPPKTPDRQAVDSVEQRLGCLGSSLHPLKPLFAASHIARPPRVWQVWQSRDPVRPPSFMCATTVPFGGSGTGQVHLTTKFWPCASRSPATFAENDEGPTESCMHRKATSSWPAGRFDLIRAILSKAQRLPDLL